MCLLFKWYQKDDLFVQDLSQHQIEHHTTISIMSSQADVQQIKDESEKIVNAFNSRPPHPRDEL